MPMAGCDWRSTNGPTAIHNDSSPGKTAGRQMDLLCGHLRCHASRRQRELVFQSAWTHPAQTPIALDRKTTYNAGPVGNDIGPLAIGNFNETMRGYGLDRQFRGEIRALQLFGSRIGGRGARSLAQIQEAMR